MRDDELRALRLRALKKHPGQRGRIDVILYDLLTDEQKREYEKLVKKT